MFALFRRRIMQLFMRFVSLQLVLFMLLGTSKAHIVDWMENPFGYAPGNAMIFYYPHEFTGHFYVDPSYYEPCTVVVNLNPSTSTLINAQVLPANPANAVTVLVQILRAPSNHVETATITGEWHATGIPSGHGCDATSPNPFSVPVSVTDQTPYWQIKATNGWINLNSGYYSALQFSSCLTGSWLNVGQGQMFNFNNNMQSGFFQRTKQLGGLIGGVMIDDSGKVMPNITLGLLYGGPTTTTDATGVYSLPRLPLGMNLIAITNPIGANLNIVLSNTNNSTATNAFTAVVIKVAMEAAPPVAPTNICNCTPWCAIGFATLPGGQTPVYYAGGANSLDGGTPDCGQPQVTVTPPTGVAFSISPGTSHHHNSGPNPAAGTWTVTSVVCGQSKSATITVP
jgi:hypothetical protein